MLAYLMQFSVPDVPGVAIYRDDTDAQQFYLYNDYPTLSTDTRTGLPLFNFTLFSRNLEIAYASAPAGQPVENQLGALNMTVDLSVSPSDEAKVREYLRRLLEEELRSPSPYNRLYNTSPRSAEPLLSPMSWLGGTVRLDLLEGLGTTFKRASSGETTPSLNGTNRAALWATFGTEGAQLLWGALHPSTPASGASGAVIDANVTYQLEAIGRTPGVRVKVQADSSVVYAELRRRTTISEQNGDQRWTYPQVSDLTRELVDNRTIDIHWDDFGIPAADPQADQVKQALEQAVLGVITNQIVGAFFKTFTLQGLKDEDLGKTFTHSTEGKPGSRLWLNEYREGFQQTLTFSMEKSQNIRFKRAPQTSLLPALTPAQRDQLVRIVDVGSPEVRVMTVQVYTNADFKADRIANITATLNYRQFDTLVNDWVETSDSFVFRTGEESFLFRTRLARDGQGRLIDLYDARAQVNYLGVAQSPPPIELKDISDRALTFSYDRLGYVKVEVQAGDIDWTQLSDVYVDFAYDAAAGEPDAKGTVRLTEQVQKGQWSTSKHGRSQNGYSYVLRYLYRDGREESDVRRTDQRGSLVVHDTLVGRLRRSFDIALDPATVTSVGLRVRYERPPEPADEARHLYTESGSWEYVRPLVEGAPTDLSYSYDAHYKDGQVDRTTWRPLARDQDLPLINVRRFRFNLMADGSGLDWERWRVALVELTYRDEGHDYLRQESVRLTKENPSGTMEVLAYAPTARQFEYHVTFAPRDGSDPIELPAPGQSAPHTGVLWLETLV